MQDLTTTTLSTLGAEPRVYVADLRRSLKYSDTWWRELRRRGIVLEPHRDPGGKRGWYTATEAAKIVAQLSGGSAPPSSTTPSL